MIDQRKISGGIEGAARAALTATVLPASIICAVIVAPRPVMAEAPAAPVSVIRTETGINQQGRLQAAWRAYQRGDFAAARSGYEETLQAWPDNRDAMLGLAASALATGDTGAAVKAYQRILRAFPQDALSGAVLLGLQQNSQAAAALRELLAGQPENPFLHGILGQLQAAQGRWPAARQSFSAAHRMEPVNPYYTLNLAISLDRMGQREQALKYYRATLRLVEQGAASLDVKPVITRILTLRQP